MAEPPARRPAIRAVPEADAGAAIGRLLAVAQSDTGQSARCADFLLAWWNGDDLGHFPVSHLWNVDDDLGEDMLVVIAFLSQHPGAIYADVFGYRDAMTALVEQKRDLVRAGLEVEAGIRIRLILDRISHAAWESEDRKTPVPAASAATIRQLAGLAKTLLNMLAPTDEAATNDALRASIERADQLLGTKRTPEDGDARTG